MSFESGLVALVTSNTAVTDLVGQRVAPAPLKQGATLPAITYDIIGITPIMAHGGDMNLDTVQVQLNIWAATYTEAAAVRDAVRGTLSGFKGLVGGEQFDGVFIAGMSSQPEPDVSEIRFIIEADITHRYQGVV